MMKKKQEKKENPYQIDYENYMDTNACTECTGLMYESAEDPEEWDAYREIFDFFPKTSPKKDSRQ